MSRYRTTRRIDATREQVFRAFTDPALMADWMDASAVRDPTSALDVRGCRHTLIDRGPWRSQTFVVRKAKDVA